MNEVVKSFYELQPQPVAIFGAGKSGQGVKNLLDKLGWEYQLFDEQERAFEMADARNCSFVVISPGFLPNHSWIQKAENLGKKILSEYEFGGLFLDEQKVVAVTGTNGKTSVTRLIEHVAQKGQIPVVAGGNLGVPVTQLIANGIDKRTTIILETSSFQSRGLSYFRPDEVIWTNFAPDHLNYHGSIKEYFLSKFQLLKVNGFRNCMIGRSVLDFAKTQNISMPPSVRVIDSLSMNDIKLPKNHYLCSVPQRENISFVREWSMNQGMGSGEFFKIAESYSGEKYRLQKVTQRENGVTFWNDSKATNLASVVAACRSFSDKLFWIGGGQDKGEEIDSFTRFLMPYVEKAFLFGETGLSLHRSFAQEGCFSILCESLKDAVFQAFRLSNKSINILLSPGFASHDLYKSYAERGKAFERIVLDLKSNREKDTSVYSQPFALQTGR